MLRENNFVFCVCGPGEKDSMIFDCAERYDPVTKQWAAVASLNFPRCGVGVCPCLGALYALGTHTPVFLVHICITIQ